MVTPGESQLQQLLNSRTSEQRVTAAEALGKVYGQQLNEATYCHRLHHQWNMHHHRLLTEQISRMADAESFQRAVITFLAQVKDGYTHMPNAPHFA